MLIFRGVKKSSKELKESSLKFHGIRPLINNPSPFHPMNATKWPWLPRVLATHAFSAFKSAYTVKRSSLQSQNRMLWSLPPALFQSSCHNPHSGHHWLSVFELAIKDHNEGPQSAYSAIAEQLLLSCFNGTLPPSQIHDDFPGQKQPSLCFGSTTLCISKSILCQKPKRLPHLDILNLH